MNQMEHRARLAVIHNEDRMREKAEMPKMGHHHYAGYNAEERAEHGRRLGIAGKMEHEAKGDNE